jgi:hypothetical protein
MMDTYESGEAYRLWWNSKLSFADFWAEMRRRAADSLGKSYEQLLVEMQPIAPIVLPPEPSLR